MASATNYPSLKNKHVFITGGATGIGAALVTSYLRQGAQVSFIDIDFSSSEKLIASLTEEYKIGENQTSSHHKPFFKICDISCIESLTEAIKEACAKHGNIDILINNVANDQRFDSKNITPQQWRNSLAINLDPAFFASQAVQPMMKKNGGGVIINFSSINAHLGPADMPSYITAKAGLLGMTKSLARDFGQYNIRVNAILPGWIVTEKQLEKWLTPQAEKAWMEQVCINKRILPEDVANLALFLTSDDAAMITSQEFIIDGGRI